MGTAFDPSAVIRQCERDGVELTERKLREGGYHTVRDQEYEVAAKWLEEQKTKEKRADDARATKLLEATQEAATAAKHSNWIGIVSAVSAVCSAAAAVFSAVVAWIVLTKG